jgi:transcriptional regulator with XRE-family HTH domain
VNQVQCRLRQYRLEAGLTQLELAARLGIHLSWLQKLEAGRGQPTVHIACLAAKILMQTVDELWPA